MRRIVFGLCVMAVAGMAAAKITTTTDVRHVPRLVRAAIPTGPPPARWCDDDVRDVGRAVLGMQDGCLWVCFGQAKGWVCK